MDIHNAIEVLLGLIAFFGGMFVKGLNDSVRSLHAQDRELTDRIHSMETLVAGNYVKKDDLDKKLDKMFEKLDIIADKMDSKVGRDECGGCTHNTRIKP